MVSLDASIASPGQIPPLGGPRVLCLLFKNVDSFKRALSFDASQNVQPGLESNGQETGMQRWKKMYNALFPDPTKLKEKVDKFMAVFDEAEEDVRYFVVGCVGAFLMITILETFADEQGCNCG